MTTPQSVPYSKDANEISIVTAFFDIGRGDWTPAHGLPAYLTRSTETYVERFGYMASLENEMVVYTSEDLVQKVLEHRKGKEHKTVVIPIDLEGMFQDKLMTVKKVQSDPEYQKIINPDLKRNPEYWSPHYVVVTNLKAVFTAHAVKNKLVHNRQVAWMDFGYCRSINSIAGSKVWQYPFTPGKVHYFTFGEYDHNTSIAQVIGNNLVYVVGASIVAEQDLWEPFSHLTQKAVKELLDRNLVDDDQTMFLLAMLYDPGMFEKHPISDTDWQPVLRLFNTNAKPA